MRTQIVITIAIVACGSPERTVVHGSKSATTTSELRPAAPVASELPPGMVRVPGTCRGKDDSDHCIPTFDIDVYEATLGELEACGAPDGASCADGTYPPELDRRIPAHAKPHYCRARGKRMSTEEEWELAALGTDDRNYPWGNELTCDKANWGAFFREPVWIDGHVSEWRGPCVGINPGQPVMPGSYPSDVSPFGVYDMAGNISELVWGPRARSRSPRGETARGMTALNERPESLRESRYRRSGARCARFVEEIVRHAPAVSPMVSVNATCVYVDAGRTDSLERVCTGAFEADVYEATIRQYELCVEEKRCPPVHVSPAVSDIVALDRPITNVSWVGARAYCQWLGKRLPNALEWRALAFGPRVPDRSDVIAAHAWCERGNWGGRFSTDHSHRSDDASQNDICHVLNPGRSLVPGTIRGDRSPLGVYDLVGNVAEWIDADGYPYVAGSHYDGSLDDFLQFTIRSAPDQPQPWLGFRCVRTHHAPPR